MLLPLALFPVLASPSLVYSLSSASILPGARLPLGGYTARKDALLVPRGDDLRVKCLALQQGDLKLILAVADMLTIPQSLYLRVSEQLPPDWKLFLVATHTHCAPDSQMLNQQMSFKIPGIAQFAPTWLDWYSGKIAGACKAAIFQRKTPVGVLRWGQRQANFNRGRRQGAMPSKMVTQIRFGRAKLLSYAAHATLYSEKELQTRGDWPGALEQDGWFVLPGAIGDVSPSAPGANPAERCRNMAFGLEKFIRGAKVIRPEFAVVTAPIPLGEVHPHPNFAKDYGIPQGFANFVVGQFAPKSAFITAFRLGPVAVVGIPGEPSAEIGRQIEEAGAKCGFAKTLVVSHVNGWMGYVLTPTDYDKGGYEATLGFYGRNQGDSLVAAATVALSYL